jgi:hypothetical protein
LAIDIHDTTVETRDASAVMLKWYVPTRRYLAKICNYPSGNGVVSGHSPLRDTN